jgi:hypothetical protein
MKKISNPVFVGVVAISLSLSFPLLIASSTITIGAFVIVPTYSKTTTAGTPLSIETIMASSSSSTTTAIAAGATEAALASLPPLLEYEEARPHQLLSPEELRQRVTGTAVAYYFSAGWCPMCTQFEVPFVEFRQQNPQIQFLYVPSDRTAELSRARAAQLHMLSVPYGASAAALKRQYKIWSGAEQSQFGTDRRSGVPAIVVLDNTEGKEVAFLPTEAEGFAALQDWPVHQNQGNIW